MKISVVVPAHNEEKDIEDALNSILEQTHKAYEVVVVNDGSTDRTQKIVECYIKKHKQIKLINFDRGHSAAFARNAGLGKVRGDITIFFDSDCVADKDFFKKVVNDFEKFDVQAVAWKTQTYKPKSLVRKAFNARRKSLPFHRLKKSQIFERECPALFSCFSTKVVKKLGGYDEDIFYFEDADLVRRFFQDGNKVYYDNRLELYHKDPDDLGSFLKQSRWIAKGLKRLFRVERKKSIVLALTHLLKTVVLFSPFTYLMNSGLGTVGLISLGVLVSVMTLHMAKNSGDISHSFIFSLITMARSPIVVYYFLID